MSLRIWIIKTYIKRLELRVLKYKEYFRKHRKDSSPYVNMKMLSWIKKDEAMIAYKKKEKKLLEEKS